MPGKARVVDAAGIIRIRVAARSLCTRAAGNGRGLQFERGDATLRDQSLASRFISSSMVRPTSASPPNTVPFLLLGHDARGIV